MAIPDPQTPRPKPASPTPEDVQRALDPPIAEGDGRGVGDTLGPDVSVEHERREIERAVYQRRAKIIDGEGG